MQKKLIIWDFDGVISDTEKLWLSSRMELLNNIHNLGWDFQTTNHYLGGMSDKTKSQVLTNLGIDTDDAFWHKAMEMDIAKINNGFALTEGIEEIFKLSDFEQCIATGGVASKTRLKIEITGIEKYFPPEKVFTADLVKYGKPEPDLFLLAAETMGYNKEQCIVVEDSIAGMTAAIRAKMKVIAFSGSDMYDKDHIKKVKELGINDIFDNMKEVKEYLIENA